MQNLEEFFSNLRPFGEQKFIDDAQLRADTVSYVGIPYSDQDRRRLILDRIPFVDRHERLEFSQSDVLAILRLPERQIGSEVVPVVRVFVRKGTVGLLVRTFVVSAESPPAGKDFRKRLEEPLKVLDEPARARVFEEFEAVLAGVSVSAPPEVGAIEMHVTCDAGHTDDDLIM
ncbi:MAG TPA: hypothetical protein PLR60_05610 [Syntrophorhabdaceae bacterium]|nr:hypothetical protein [Syntrophorhabdaceae bacterium]